MESVFQCFKRLNRRTPWREAVGVGTAEETIEVTVQKGAADVLRNEGASGDYCVRLHIREGPNGDAGLEVAVRSDCGAGFNGDVSSNPCAVSYQGALPNDCALANANACANVGTLANRSTGADDGVVATASIVLHHNITREHGV